MVRIVQCLCPSRHCILALSYEPGLTAAQKEVGGAEDITLDESNAAGYLRSLVEGMIARTSINPFCGLCGHSDFIYEDSPTIFQHMADALPLLRRLEYEMLQTREFFAGVKARSDRQ